MPSYLWKGRTRNGSVHSGIETAGDKAAVVRALRAREIVPTLVREKGREIALPSLGRPVSDRSLALFTRKFSVMIDAGLPLVSCLEILGRQQQSRAFAGVLARVRSDVEGGASLSDALKRHPSVFDDLYCNMIAAGEAGGMLDVILQRLAAYIEKASRLKSQVRSAMIYPATVLSIAAVVVAIIMVKVIPTFSALFADMGAALPLPTRIVIALSNAVLRYGVPMAGLALLGAYALRKYHGTRQGRRVLDGLLLKLPVLGDLLTKVAVARFCRTLSALTTSGVPILDGLEITARTVGNAVVEDAVMATRKGISEGKPIAEPLRATGVFPGEVPEMIDVGEQTGALDAMLSKIADFYEEEVDTAVAGLISMLEPIMIALLGVIVGGIVIAMYMPILGGINL